MARQFGERTFTFTKAYLSAYDIVADAYNATVVALQEGQMLKVEPEAQTDSPMAYGAVAATLTVITSAKLTFKLLGIDTAAWAIITGETVVVSGVAGNQIRDVPMSGGGSGLPYFGMIGVGVTDDGGIATIGIKAAKLDKYPDYTLDGENNKYNVSETAGKAIVVAGQFGHLKQYEDATDFTAPVDAATFAAFMTNE